MFVIARPKKEETMPDKKEETMNESECCETCEDYVYHGHACKCEYYQQWTFNVNHITGKREAVRCYTVNSRGECPFWKEKPCQTQSK